MFRLPLYNRPAQCIGTRWQLRIVLLIARTVQSAPGNLYWRLRPGQHLVAGYSNLMYADYEDSLQAADLADLIAYLLTV